MFQVEYVTPKKKRLSEEQDQNPNNVHLYIFSTKRR